VTESVWGTSVAPAAWTEWLPGESMGRKQNYVTSNSMGNNQLFARSTRTAATTRKAEGAIPIEVPNKGFSSFLNLLHGKTVTPKKEVENAYVHTHEIGTTDPYKKSLTVVKAAPKVEGGTVDSYCYPGFILNSMDFALATNGILLCTLNANAKDEDQSQSIGTVAYPASVENYNFVQCVVKIGGAEQKFLRDFKLNIAKPTDTNRAFLGSATMAQPLTNAFSTGMLELTADYSNNTLYKMFEKNETKLVEILFTGAVAAGSEKFTLEFKIPVARFEGDSPNVENLGPLGQKIPLKIEYNGTEPPITIVYKTLDVTIA